MGEDEFAANHGSHVCFKREGSEQKDFFQWYRTELEIITP